MTPLLGERIEHFYFKNASNSILIHKTIKIINKTETNMQFRTKMLTKQSEYCAMSTSVFKLFALKWSACGEIDWAVGTHFSGRCRFREVKTRVNVGTVRRDTKSSCCRDVAIVQRWPLVKVRLYVSITR